MKTNLFVYRSSCLSTICRSSLIQQCEEAFAYEDIFREAEDGRGGDSAWPLSGLAMRIIQAVSLSSDDLRLLLSDGSSPGWTTMGLA